MEYVERKRTGTRSFVENICRKWQIPCTVYCYDVPGLSREWKLGEEETGRIVRKEAFQREAAVCGRKDSEIKIALAHNQEDLRKLCFIICAEEQVCGDYAPCAL